MPKVKDGIITVRDVKTPTISTNIKSIRLKSIRSLLSILVRPLAARKTALIPFDKSQKRTRTIMPDRMNGSCPKIDVIIPVIDSRTDVCILL